MPSAAGIAFTLLSLALAWLLWSGRGLGEVEPDSRLRLRLRSLVPPLLLAACLPSGCASERFDTLRLYANGMEVTEVAQRGGRSTAPATPGCENYFSRGDSPVFVVGRNRACVDLVVQDASGADVDGAFVRLDHAAGGEAALRLFSRTGGGGAVVAAYDGDEGRTYAGAVPLQDGDRLCLSGCSGANAAWWTFRADGRLEPAAGGEARTLATRGGLYGTLQPYGPTTRIHRLSTALCRERDGNGACLTPATADPAGSEAGAPALSFLFQRGGLRGGDWFAMLLDPGAQLRRGDGSVVRANTSTTVPLAEGSSRRVALFGLRGNALRELRSFTLGHALVSDPSAQRRFTLALDTPELIPIGHCSRPLSRLAISPDQSSAEAFSIPALGSRPGSVLASAAAGLPIENFNLCRSTSFAFRAPLDRPIDDAAAGSVRRQLDFTVDRMGIPWTLVLLAFAVALVVHAASERVWLRNRLDGQVLILAQYLLVLRAIIGIEGVFADPALDWRIIYADVGTALVALPAILIAARRRSESSLITLGSVALFAILALAALWWWLGAPDRIAQLLTLLAFGALAARAASLSWGKPSPLVGEVGGGPAASAAERTPPSAGEEKSLSAADAAGPPPTSPIRGRGFQRFLSFGSLLDRPPTFWLWLLGAIVIVRILLGLLGFRERLFGITLSAVYVPLLLAAIAAILAQAEQASDRKRLGLIFLGALAVGVGLVAMVINDVGFALVHVPPIAGIALWRLRRWRQPAADESASGRRDWREWAPWALPAAGLIVGYFALWAMIAVTPPPSEEAPLEQRVAYAVDERASDPNWLRLRAVFAPGQINRIGTRNAAVQLDQSLLLQELTGTVLGRGWLTPVDLGSFRYQTTHLSDYLSASHVMAPFGRAGALALLLVLAAAAGAAVSQKVPVPAAWPSLAGALAIWTLFGAAAYMVLANLLLVPFTGRNIYLLAASSGGDLIEGLGLLLMARIGLAYRRNA